MNIILGRMDKLEQEMMNLKKNKILVHHQMMMMMAKEVDKKDFIQNYDINQLQIMLMMFLITMAYKMIKMDSLQD